MIILFGVHYLLDVAEASTLCVFHVDYLALCVTNAVSFVVILLQTRPLTHLIGPCLLPHYVFNKLRPRGMRNFELAASTDFLQNFIVYIGDRQKERTHAYIQTQSKTNETHLGLGTSVQGPAVAQLVEAFRYKLEGRGFVSQ